MPDWTEEENGSPRRRSDPEEPEGSGVAIRAGGYVVTNHHVLGRASSVSVRLRDGRILPAEIVGRDAATDLAVLKVTSQLPILPIGDTPALGAPVCAIGNQFGLGLSVTCGVVSAVHRTGVGFNPIEDFIQTDAVINPGASGGALVDGDGRLVGVISAIFTKEVDANIGVNFASAMPLVERVVDDLIAHGRVLRGRSGMRVRDLSRAERRRMVGARIVRLVAGGAAEKAGLAVGDVITRIGTRSVRKASDVPSALQLVRPGEDVELAILREGVAQSHRLAIAP
ncbi:MAG: trypsin-like peptidase domain-containing protein [Alphaproteobacteria bacterium]|nr:trypsin-like peptidase domain-containing protein [Alphaproteobacteria bacterium]